VVLSAANLVEDRAQDTSARALQPSDSFIHGCPSGAVGADHQDHAVHVRGQQPGIGGGQRRRTDNYHGSARRDEFGDDSRKGGAGKKRCGDVNLPTGRQDGELGQGAVLEGIGRCRTRLQALEQGPGR